MSQTQNQLDTHSFKQVKQYYIQLHTSPIQNQNANSKKIVLFKNNLNSNSRLTTRLNTQFNTSSKISQFNKSPLGESKIKNNRSISQSSHRIINKNALKILLLNQKQISTLQAQGFNCNYNQLISPNYQQQQTSFKKSVQRHKNQKKDFNVYEGYYQERKRIKQQKKHINKELKKNKPEIKDIHSLIQQLLKKLKNQIQFTSQQVLINKLQKMIRCTQDNDTQNIKNALMKMDNIKNKKMAIKQRVRFDSKAKQKKKLQYKLFEKTKQEKQLQKKIQQIDKALKKISK